MPGSGVTHLKWDHHMQNIASLFNDLFSSDSLTDVTISCREGSLHAHKLVLSACSPYFSDLLRKSPKNTHPILIMHGISFDNMKILLEFIYKGVVDVPEKLVPELLVIAENLDLKGFYLDDDLPDGPEQRKTDVEHQPLGHKNAHTSNQHLQQKKRKNESIGLISNGNHDLNAPLTSSTPKSLQITSVSNEHVGRQTRFKGMKRVPVGEVSRNDVEVMRASTKKKTPKSTHSDDFMNNFVIRDISGGNGSIFLSMNPKTNTCSNQNNLQMSQDEREILQVTPLITISESATSQELKFDQDDTETNAENMSIETCTEIITDDGSELRQKCEDLGSSNDNHKLIKPFRCEYCRAQFARASHLARHRRMHTGERPFSCKKCDKRFARQDKLKLHLRSHDDDTDYVPKLSKGALLFGTPIESYPAAATGNTSTVTQSIIRSLNDISSIGDTTIPLLKKRRRGRPRTKEIRINFERRPRGRPRKIRPKTEPENTSGDNYDITTLPYGDFSYLTSELSPHLTVSEPSALYESVPIETMSSYETGNISIAPVSRKHESDDHQEDENVSAAEDPADDLLHSIRLIGECTIRPVT